MIAKLLSDISRYGSVPSEKRRILPTFAFPRRLTPETFFSIRVFFCVRETRNATGARGALSSDSYATVANCAEETRVLPKVAALALAF